jgi:hypothetical protein
MTMKRNQSIRTDVQFLLIFSLTGPTVHRLEKVQFEGSTVHLAVLMGPLATVTDTMEMAGQQGLGTLRQSAGLSLGRSMSCTIWRGV